MLKAGKTPEDLIKEINAATREIKKEEAAAAKRAENEKKVVAARAKVVEAMKEYSKLMYGVEPNIEIMDSFNKDLEKIEKASKLVSVDDDERIRKFLRGILM